MIHSSLCSQTCTQTWRQRHRNGTSVSSSSSSLLVLSIVLLSNGNTPPAKCRQSTNEYGFDRKGKNLTDTFDPLLSNTKHLCNAMQSIGERDDGGRKELHFWNRVVSSVVFHQHLSSPTMNHTPLVFNSVVIHVLSFVGLQWKKAPDGQNLAVLRGERQRQVGKWGGGLSVNVCVLHGRC